MTPQEIFDTVVAHIEAQKVRAHDGLYCCYRTPDGLKCALGCLIPDEDYKPIFEGYMADDLLDIGYTPKWLVENLDMIELLQIAHDVHLEHGLHEWRNQMGAIARRYSLEYTPKEE